MLHQAGRTRTSDSLDPNQVLYQTELRPVELGSALNVSLVSHDQGAMRRSSLSGATTTSVNTRRVERLVSLPSIRVVGLEPTTSRPPDAYSCQLSYTL